MHKDRGKGPLRALKTAVYCNRTATGLGQGRTEQKNGSTKNAENRIYKPNYRTC